MTILNLTTSSKEGDSYFVISKKWYTSWQKYLEPSGGAPKPGPIDNRDIIDTANDTRLRRFLVEDEDYILVTQQVWTTLLEWYNGGPAIPMTVMDLVVSDARNDNITDISLAKQASIRELYAKVCAKTGVPLEKARIWDYFKFEKGQLLHPLSNKSLEESGLVTGQDILLEVDGSSAVNELVPVPLQTSGLVGLFNLGNTCYMNSTLQCLAHTPPILQYFLQDKRSGISGELAKAFGELLKLLWSSGSNAIIPNVFKAKLDQAAPQFRGHDQHDAHELLTCLSANLHELSHIWRGECKSILVCPVCGEEAVTDDTFTCLSLPLPSTRTRSTTLLSCLEKYLAEEPLGPDTMRFCPQCKEKREVNKKLDLRKLPDVLVFQLIRFQTSKYFIRKMVTFVNFPINNLDLSKYVKNGGKSYLYELYAVSNHHGGIKGDAHYTAYAKLIDDNKWYCFNDNSVSHVNVSKIKSSDAYLLFYRRVGSETEVESADVSRTNMDESRTDMDES